MASEKIRSARERLRRSFITPEGVDLDLLLAGAGERAVAFAIDLTFIVLFLVALTIAALSMLSADAEIAAMIWLIGFFLLRNFYFVAFEAGKRGATPGKRLLGLRVIARDGARLSTAAVIARNALREIEIFLPLSFLGAQAAESKLDATLGTIGLIWSGLFLFFPLLNKDRLRAGDLIAGTWVVQVPKARLAADMTDAAAETPRHSFTDEMLSIYGVYELQTLEKVLREARSDSISSVAAAIRAKAGIADEGEDEAFLYDYYAALCARLEREIALGRRRENKDAASAVSRPVPARQPRPR